MIDGIPVFDCVIHVYDISDDNIRDDVPTAAHAQQHIAFLQSGSRFLPENRDYPIIKRWTPEETYDVVFTKGGTDLAMAQTVPLYDWFSDWLAPVKAQHAMAQAYPDEVLFCGGVDPIVQGLEGALEAIDVQAKELGARSFKFYNGHVDDAWRCDDEQIAYPMYRRILEHGIDVIQFHKGSPFGQQNMEHLSPLDLQKAARDFPEMNFIIHHGAIPYFAEALNICQRFPNVYIALSGNINAYFYAPRMVQEWIGQLLQQCGAHKILWGSESPLQGIPRTYLEMFVHQFEIPKELRSGWGYPQITREDKELILGGNLARLMKIDLAAIAGKEAVA